MSEIADLAKGFVEMYLEEMPNRSEVVGYIFDNIEDEENVNDELIAEVIKYVNAQLDMIAQRYGDDL